MAETNPFTALHWLDNGPMAARLRTRDHINNSVALTLEYIIMVEVSSC